jgi:putative ABC transport system permease protein
MSTLLRWLAGRSLAEDIAGDLMEERRRRSQMSPRSAAFWYWRQFAAILFRAALARASGTAAAMARAVGVLAQPQSLRYAIRSLRRASMYSTASIGVIALSTALAATVFAVVDGVLFKPLPYPDAHRLVTVEAGFRDAPQSARQGISLSDVETWRASVPAMAFTVFRTTSSSRLEEVNDQPMGVAEVDAQFFDVIGVRPLLGGFKREHFIDPSEVGVTILSYRLWQSRFNGSPDIVGTRIVRGLATMEIVGVMPKEFVFPAKLDAQVLMPLVPTPNERTNPRARSFDVVARLRRDLSREAATERLAPALAVVARSFPPLPPPRPGTRYANDSGPFQRVTLHALGERLAAGSRALFLVVSLSAGALVLLGCVNVSGLMAARNFDRAGEIALRRALGASDGEVGGLIAAEAACLVVAGTAMGVAFSSPLLNTAIGLLPGDLTLLKTPQIDWRVSVFAAVMTGFAIVLVSMWPIRRGLRTSSAQGAADGRLAPRTRSVGRTLLIASQVAIGLVLTLGGALLVGSLARLWQEDVGMVPGNVTAVELRIPAAVLDSEPGILDLATTRLLADVRQLPGVVRTGATDAALFRNLSWMDLGFRPPPTARSKPWIDLHGVTGGFFETVQLRVVAGRLPTDDELDSGRQLIVVSESVARAYWPDVNPIGQQLELRDEARRRFEVIGVVADARFRSWDDAQAYPIYGSMKAFGRGVAPTILIRTGPGSAGEVLGQTLALIDRMAPRVRAIRATALDAMMAESVRQRRFQAWLFGSFAVAALAIVGVGVLGLMGMTMARRTREIGIRVAVGATRRSVVRLLVGEQVTAVVGGALAGCLTSYWLVEFIKVYLYGLTPYDPIAWTGGVALIVALALAGALIPALRATRVDPVRALRAE